MLTPAWFFFSVSYCLLTYCELGTPFKNENHYSNIYQGLKSISFFLLSLLCYLDNTVILKLLTLDLCKGHMSFLKWHFLKPFRMHKESHSGILPKLYMIVFLLRVYGINIILRLEILNTSVFQWSYRRVVEVYLNHLNIRLH